MTILAKLRAAIASGQLPPKAMTQANHLCDRLEQPVRVAVLGKRGMGKSTLRDLLAGAPVIPADRGMPTLELTYGDTARSICTLPDGSKTTIDGNDPARITACAPIFVQMQLPLPALTKISLLDVVAPDDPAAMTKASQWATSRSDIILWCSDSFAPGEQQIWAQMPDPVKDHAFLMITKADLLRGANRLDAVLAQAGMVARDEFHEILAIAAAQAVAARTADGSVDTARLRDSGGLALIGALSKQVALGKQAASDMAEILLAQNPVARAAPVAAPLATTDGRPVYRLALDHIRADCAALVAQAQGDDPLEAAQIMAMIVARLHWLCDHLHTQPGDADEGLRQMQQTAFDAADLAQLMQIEKRDSAALDAASLLLQVKNELAARQAA